MLYEVITESIDRFEQAYADLAQRIRRLEDRQDEYANTVLEAQKQLDEIHKARYDIKKNLGWARLGQGRYQEALAELNRITSYNVCYTKLLR